MKTMATETKEVKSKAQRAKELKEKYETLVSEAKQEQLDIINTAIEELSALGYVYTLSEGNAPQEAKSGATGRSGRPKGYKMTEEQKQAMREGRRRAKEERAKQQASPAV